jgi:hypothetical protein
MTATVSGSASLVLAVCVCVTQQNVTRSLSSTVIYDTFTAAHAAIKVAHPICPDQAAAVAARPRVQMWFCCPACTSTLACGLCLCILLQSATRESVCGHAGRNVRIKGVHQ